MNTRSAIELCKTNILPLCKDVAQRLMSEVASIRASTFDGPVGSLTTYDGYHCGVECLFVNAPSGGEDLLALTVDIGHRDKTAEVSVSICWGSGRIVAEQFPGNVPLSDAAMAEVIDGFPRLSAILVSTAQATSHDA